MDRYLGSRRFASLPAAASIALAALIAAAPTAAQRSTPCSERTPDGWSAAIASAEEPGVRLVIEGRVVTGEGRSPVAGARVLAYHTDAEGYYSVDGKDEGNARLCAVVTTDAEGRYRLETIRPAHYATGGPPAHVHFEVSVDGGSERRLTLNFEGDPQLRGRAAGEVWGTIRPLKDDGEGGLRVLRDLWLR